MNYIWKEVTQPRIRQRAFKSCGNILSSKCVALTCLAEGGAFVEDWFFEGGGVCGAILAWVTRGTMDGGLTV